MTNLTGIRDAEYLSSFLGKKIAIREQDGTISVYPLLSSIFANKLVHVQDSDGYVHEFSWKQCENPYVILMEDVVMK